MQAAVNAADAIIRKYLKSSDDPAWDETTAPPDIKHAVKLMTAHIYEHRGDAFGPDQDNDDRVWAAVANVLRMWRNPPWRNGDRGLPPPRHVSDPTAMVPDGEGGFIEGWADLDPADWPVRITPATARDMERVASGTVITSATHVIEGRWRPE